MNTSDRHSRVGHFTPPLFAMDAVLHMAYGECSNAPLQPLPKPERGTSVGCRQSAARPWLGAGVTETLGLPRTALRRQAPIGSQAHGLPCGRWQALPPVSPVAPIKRIQLCVRVRVFKHQRGGGLHPQGERIAHFGLRVLEALG